MKKLFGRVKPKDKIKSEFGVHEVKKIYFVGFGSYHQDMMVAECIDGQKFFALSTQTIELV